MPRPGSSRRPQEAGSRSGQKRQFKPSDVRFTAEALAVGSVPEKYVRAVDQLFAALGGQHEILASAVRPRSVYSKANIVGAGVGLKQTAGQGTGTMCVHVFVVKKLPLNKLDRELRVPDSIKVGSEDVPTDVIETGEIVPMPAPTTPFGDVIHAQAVGVFTGRDRPAAGGDSIGHPRVTAGTLGCLVARNDGLYILSNNHVLGAVNQARKGDPIFQPGPVDDGKSADTIAQIDSDDDIIQLDFSPGAVNDVDATLALTNDVFTVPQMADGTAIDDPTPLAAFVGMNVQKVGRSSGHTFGQIRSVLATITCNYERGRFAQFQNQIMIQSLDGSLFSQPGDSGSLIMSVDPAQPVGLLFSGSDRQTYATPIQAVMDAFGGFDVLADFGGS